MKSYRLRGDSGPLFLGQMVRIGCTFLATLLVTEFGTVDDGARLFIALAAARFVSPLVALGGGDAALRLASSGANSLQVALRLSPASGLLAVAASIAAGVSLPALARSPGWGLSFAAFTFALTLAYPLRAWLHAAMLADGRPKVAGLHESFRGLGPLSGVGAAVLLGAEGHWLLVSYAGGSLLANLILHGIEASPGSVGAGSLSLGDLPVDRKHSARIAFGGVMRAGYESADQLLLPLFVSLAAVRDYGLAASATYSLMTGVAAIAESKVPELYRDAPQNSAVRAGTRGLLVPAVAAYLAAAGLASLLSWWFDSVGILYVTLLLGLVLPLRAVSYLPLARLTASREQGRRNRIEFAGGVGNATGNLALIPLLGPLGAAATSVLAEAWMAVAGWRSLRRSS